MTVNNRDKKRTALHSQKDFKDILEIPTNDNILNLSSNNIERNRNSNKLTINQINISNNELNTNNKRQSFLQTPPILTIHDCRRNDNEHGIKDSNIAELASSEGSVEGDQQLRSLIEFDLNQPVTNKNVLNCSQ